MAEFFTSEVTGYSANGTWHSLSNGYPDRLKIIYSTSIASDGRIAISWAVYGDCDEGKKSDETFTKIYSCILTIDGTNVLSKTWTSGNLKYGTLLGSGTTYFDASRGGQSIIIQAQAAIYASWINSTASQTVVLPSRKVQLAYHPNGGDVVSSTYGTNDYGYVALNGSWNFHQIFYPNSDTPKNPADLGISRTGYVFSHWSPWLRNGGVQTATQFYPGQYYPSTYYYSTEGTNITTANTELVNCYLMAQWIPKTITVRFYQNAGDLSIYEEKTYTYGSHDSNFTTKYYIDGWTPLGWAYSSDATKIAHSYDSAIGDSWINAQYNNYPDHIIHLFLVWERNVYENTIQHWSWGYQYGEGTNANRNAFHLGQTKFYKYYGDVFQLTTNDALSPPNGFGYPWRFGSDSISPDGSWNNYSLGENIWQPSHNCSFEFDYEPVIYNISYINLIDGENLNNPNNYNVLYGVTFNPPSKNATGYNFSHWTINSTPTNGINIGANASFSSVDDLYNKCQSRTTGDQWITANWIPKTITIRYHYNYDGSGDYAEQNFVYNAPLTEYFGFYWNEANELIPIWDPEIGYPTEKNKQDYAKDYGFGQWMWLGYKLVGWTDKIEPYNYGRFSSVDPSWLNMKYDYLKANNLNHLDLFPLLEPIGTVQIWNGSQYRHSIPYIYTNGKWEQVEGCIYKNGWQKGV